MLRRFGFRTVLVGNGVLQAATMLGLRRAQPSTPLALILALLVISGASRSTAVHRARHAGLRRRAAGADGGGQHLVQRELPARIGMGVALGALFLRLAGAAVGSQTSPAAFHAAFATVAVITLLLATAAVRLRPDAGAAVSGHHLARA